MYARVFSIKTAYISVERIGARHRIPLKGSQYGSTKSRAEEKARTLQRLKASGTYSYSKY